MRSSTIASSMAVGLLVGCAGIGGDRGANAGASAGDSIGVRLTATRANTGEIGQVILTPRGDKTDVTVQASGLPDHSTRPVHLYTYIHEGTCDNSSPTPAYALTDRVLAESVNVFPHMANAGPPFKVSNTAPVALATLRSSPHAIKVRSAPADGNVDIFCGDIGRR